ncbi:putative ubiquitin-conjugating enzyme E2, ubiquitin-conjugating enzyme/RWD [Helianthus anomalus]
MNFKKFDVVEDYSDHHYLKSKSSWWQPPKKWTKKIQEEWRILKRDLPDMIYVRVYEGRMDLLRAVIIGVEGTPYNDGLFFFDVCFPKNYPNEPPVCLHISPFFHHMV